MRMSVAGATGAIRRPLFTTLIAARREVVGMTSSARGLIALQKYGADGDDSRCVPLASSWANTIVGLVKDYGNRYQAFVCQVSRRQAGRCSGKTLGSRSASVQVGLFSAAAGGTRMLQAVMGPSFVHSLRHPNVCAARHSFCNACLLFITRSGKY